MESKLKLFRESEENADINVSPLLDMVFILLIFFVVTTTFTRETGVEVKKPKAASASQVKDKIIKIAVTREGTIHVHEKQVDLLMLEAILKREKMREPDLKAIVIADDNSLTGRVVQVIDKCNLSGVTDISIAALTEH
ncbi:MAG: biopolymer transporter ExbD [Spirochaetes bacterium GWF1_41_5]|nr:MAG: biopolymer transporter ExbD [Spirochaetes bacterium GWF1_41_5]HBE04658.1 biopolymer transporter ExbD [Spirochaetia bacterium]